VPRAIQCELITETPIYDGLHNSIPLVNADLKTDKGQKVPFLELAKANVLLTSFHPSALKKAVPELGAAT
jgi:crotonobetainyl-CoA:carnitine CoA-transferase CaiB-like acyl-CoA transferase